jgi:hypothetical protein
MALVERRRVQAGGAESYCRPVVPTIDKRSRKSGLPLDHLHWTIGESG